VGQVVLNARELVGRLWAETEARKVLEDTVPSLPDAGSLQHGHILRHLNANWQFDLAPFVGGSTGIRRRVKQRVARTVVSFLQEYFQEERDFMAHLVRLQNELAARSDESAAEVRQVVQSLRAVVTMLSERDDRLHALAEARLEQLQAAIDQLQRSTAQRS